MTEATIPEERFQQEVERRKAAERQAAEAATQLQTLTAQVTELTAKVESASTLQAELETARTQAQTQAHHVGMLEAGVSTQSVRDFMLHQHHQHRQQAGAEAQPWADWFGANKQRMIDDLSSLRPPAPAPAQTPAQPPAQAPAQALAEQPAVPPQPPAPAPQANNGAQPTPPPSQPFVPGSISGLSIEEFKANKEALISGLNGTWPT